jgi:hypothetical protein
MDGRTLFPYSAGWVRKWWLQCFTPRRRPVVLHKKPTLETLEDRNSPTSLHGGTLAETAPPPL